MKDTEHTPIADFEIPLMGERTLIPAYDVPAMHARWLRRMKRRVWAFRLALVGLVVLGLFSLWRILPAPVSASTSHAGLTSAQRAPFTTPTSAPTAPAPAATTAAARATTIAPTGDRSITSTAKPEPRPQPPAEGVAVARGDATAERPPRALQPLQPRQQRGGVQDAAAPTSRLRAQLSLFATAQAAIANNDHVVARRTLTQLLAQYPDGPLAAEAQALLASTTDDDNAVAQP